MNAPMPQPTLLDPDAIQIRHLFVTPIASVVHPDAQALNRQLHEVITQRMAVDPGTSHSNQGGWQSPADFSQWGGEPAQALLAFGLALANQLTAVYSAEHGLVEPTFTWRHSAWANVNHPGDSNHLHGHPGAYWSGVYWVDDGGRQEDPAVGGDLEFPDPRGMMPSVYSPDLRMRIEGCLTAGYSSSVAPATGTFVMFPSWLMHSVQRFNGTRPRISVAFNFGI
ncbi:TIGR02466 family protein [Pantoea sp. Tr-811]|uniref:TIGR02466 family protein n=1 Tax=Pantoea sp. Tr-811 TaxID=2608361 RepID=UPI0019633D63|nr:TIGR02466 family protein [Pantoea sp. Tr-811]